MDQCCCSLTCSPEGEGPPKVITVVELLLYPPPPSSDTVTGSPMCRLWLVNTQRHDSRTPLLFSVFPQWRSAPSLPLYSLGATSHTTSDRLGLTQSSHCLVGGGVLSNTPGSGVFPVVTFMLLQKGSQVTPAFVMIARWSCPLLVVRLLFCQ